MQNFDHNIGFWEKRQFFRRKLSKIAENCDHNIDPWLNSISRPIAPVSSVAGGDITTRPDHAARATILYQKKFQALEPWSWTGWPDEFVKNIAQNEAQNIFCGNNSPKNVGYSCNSQKAIRSN
jgi:hypothetical protein